MARAVFHAPMSALNADADWNACEPNTLGFQICKVSIRSHRIQVQVCLPVLWGVWLAEHTHIHPREHIL